MERFMMAGLSVEVSRRALPGAVFGFTRTEASLIELSEIDLKRIDFKVELQESVLPKLRASRERLGRLMPGGILSDFDSINKYWLIYRFAQDAYDVKWYGLMLTHAHESTFSRDPAAFSPNRKVVGAMQRTKELYKESQVNEASRGYEFLSRLSQNHPTDWKEILWAAWKLDQDARVTSNADKKDRNWAIGDAIQRYSPDGEIRRQEFETLRGIFG